MTAKLPRAARLATKAVALALVLQAAAAWAEQTNENRPLRRWLASRQQAQTPDANAQQAPDTSSSRRANPSWRQDPRYQYRGVFENWNAVPNDIYGRTHVYSLPPAEAYQKMYGPPPNYPQSNNRGLGALFASKNNKQNNPNEGGTAAETPNWAQPPQPRPAKVPVPPIPIAPIPAPLVSQPSLQPLPSSPSLAEPVQKPSAPPATFSRIPAAPPKPLTVPNTAARLVPTPKPSVAAPATPAPASPPPALPVKTVTPPATTVAQPAATIPSPATPATPSPASAAPPTMPALPEFDFPDPPKQGAKK